MNTLSWAGRIRAYAAAHKVISTIIVLVALYGCYYVYGVFTAPSTATRYVTTQVATGTVVASLTETGQVSASSNIDVQSKSSGAVLSLYVSAGQHVVAGTPLASIDPTTAQQNVRSAEQAVQSAQIALATAEGNVVQSRTTAYNDVSSSMLNLPSVLTGLDTVLHGSAVPGHLYESNANAYATLTQSYNPSIPGLRDLAESAYQKAAASYAKATAAFTATPRTADTATIDTLITETAQATADISDALRAATNFFNAINAAYTSHSASVNPPPTLAGHLSTLVSYTSTTNGYATSLANDVANLASNADTGGDPLTIQSGKLSLQMKQDALAQAEQALADTTVRAPFSGTVAKLAVQQYQTIGSGTAVATMVSDNQSVAISVNEVDAAKLKLGKKATITFDALPTVSIAGTLSSINTIGTVTSGVVSYGAVVTFDTPNTSVKPGMSATANIIVGTQDGLVVPSSAVKTSNGQSYVLTFSPPLAGSQSSAGAVSAVAPIQTPVTTGLTDNSTVIITRGLVSGEQVVTKTLTGASAAAASSAAQSTSLFGIGGVRTGGVGASGATRTTSSGNAAGTARAPAAP